jgi:hypothetical protein
MSWLLGIPEAELDQTFEPTYVREKNKMLIIQKYLNFTAG